MPTTPHPATPNASSAVQAESRTFKLGKRFFWFTGIGVGFATLLTAANIGLSWYSRVLTLADRTTETRPIDVEIARNPFAIPANMIRFSRHRSGGVHNAIELAVYWPLMTGYSATLASAFDDTSSSAQLILLSVESRQTDTDTTGRLAPIYARFFTGSSTRTHGLILQPMLKGGGYGNEQIAFEAGAVKPFVARCYATVAAGQPDTCMREIHVEGGLSVRYRFRLPMLANWRELDPAIRRLFTSLRKS